MSERERLIELLDQNCGYVEEQKAEMLADYLLENGIIVPPCNRVYFIVDKGTQFEYVGMIDIHCLKIYEIKDLSKYGYYTTKEQAEKALEGGAE